MALGSYSIMFFKNISICCLLLLINKKLFQFNKNTEMDDLVLINKTPLDKPKPKIKQNPAITILKKSQIKKHGSKEEDLDAKDKGPLRLEAKILNYQSPSLIYLSLVHQQKMFNEMFEKIQNYYNITKMQDKKQWEVGDRCCVLSAQSSTWRRAAIVQLEEDRASVFYSDFACVETVPIAGLRELAQEFNIGDAAITCHLCGVVPAVGDEWPSLTKEYLKELLDAYRRVFITKLGKFKGKSMPVQLWVYHTTQGNALEPNISEWRCLNDKIIEQGLGVPDKSERVGGSEVAATDAGDDTISFLNISGSVRDWLQTEPMPLKPLNINQNPRNESQPSTPVDDDAEEAKEGSHDATTVFISDWLPPEPLPCSEFTAMPTYIDNDGVIYLHDVSQHDTLDMIRKALDVRFNKPDPKAKFVKWTVGEPCVALFFLDNRFYRGRVLEVNEETSSCLIHYIDYGNEENCAFENLRKSIALYQIPTQAHKCILSRIRPIKKNWDRMTLDYIHKFIVEKECFVKVSGEPIGELTPIELKYDKLWVNDHLVDFEMATYSDGTKAIVRKFAPTAKDIEKLEESLGSDSGPDYIIECDSDDNLNQSSESYVAVQTSGFDFEHKDWNQIMDEETGDITGNFMTYPPYTKTEFKCKIFVLHDINTFELNIVHDDETALRYDEMYAQIQCENNDVPLNGIYENKACLALFSEDEKWYRASILQYCETSGRIKVKYVDFGNKEILSLADVREISEKYTKLPPANVTVTLHNVEVNPNLDKEVVVKKLAETFLDKTTFHATIISNDFIPSVELRDNDRNLVYESLIKENVFTKRN